MPIHEVRCVMILMFEKNMAKIWPKLSCMFDILFAQADVLFEKFSLHMRI